MQPLNEIWEGFALTVFEVLPCLRFNGRPQNVRKVVFDLLTCSMNPVEQVLSDRLVILLRQFSFSHRDRPP